MELVLRIREDREMTCTKCKDTGMIRRNRKGFTVHDPRPGDVSREGKRNSEYYSYCECPQGRAMSEVQSKSMEEKRSRRQKRLDKR